MKYLFACITSRDARPVVDVVAYLNKTPRFVFPAVRAASSGGDFMSDLFNKLAMRRKGEKSFHDNCS